MATKRLYRKGGKARSLAKFRKRYGSRGAYIFGAVVGKVKRERRHKYGRKRR